LCFGIPVNSHWNALENSVYKFSTRELIRLHFFRNLPRDALERHYFIVQISCDMDLTNDRFTCLPSATGQIKPVHVARVRVYACLLRKLKTRAFRYFHSGAKNNMWAFVNVQLTATQRHCFYANPSSAFRARAMQNRPWMLSLTLPVTSKACYVYVGHGKAS